MSSITSISDTLFDADRLNRAKGIKSKANRGRENYFFKQKALCNLFPLQMTDSLLP